MLCVGWRKEGSLQKHIYVIASAHSYSLQRSYSGNMIPLMILSV